MNRLPYAAVLAVLLLGSPWASAWGLEAPPPETRIVPTDGPVTSTTGTYVYDPSGNVAAIGANSYIYDPMNRVTTGSVDRFGNVQSQTYTYDVYGNRLSDGSVSYPASTVTNQLTGSAAQYDAAGNLTQWQPPGSTAVRSYSYDAMNTVMREKVTVGSTNKYVVHIYTADDERYWEYRDYGTGTVEMTYALRDLGGSVLREYVELSSPPSVAWTARDYVYRDNALLASYDTASGDTLHYSLDHLGTPRMVTDQDHVKVAEHTYFPFGAEYTDSSPTDGRLRFTGHEERDEDFLGETRGELDYMHARYYGSAPGRFFSVDPGSDWSRRQPQSWNLYGYVRNNPMNMIDPDGMQIVITAPRVKPSDPWFEHMYAEYLQDVAAWRDFVLQGGRHPLSGMTMREHVRASELGVTEFVDGVIPGLDVDESDYDANVEGLEHSEKVGAYTRDLEIALAIGGATMETRAGAEGGNWVTQNVFRWGRGVWKNSGGPRWHFHLGPGKGVMRHHLPQQFNTWRHHAPQVIKRWYNGL